MMLFREKNPLAEHLRESLCVFRVHAAADVVPTSLCPAPLSHSSRRSSAFRSGWAGRVSFRLPASCRRTAVALARS